VLSGLEDLAVDCCAWFIGAKAMAKKTIARHRVQITARTILKVYCKDKAKLSFGDTREAIA
jgi:hypothetical protein